MNIVPVDQACRQITSTVGDKLNGHAYFQPTRTLPDDQPADL
jgi:hypothetical protein